MSDQPREMTWTRAVILGLLVAATLLIFLAFIPSIFTYWWGGQVQNVIDLVKRVTGREIQPYTTVRLRDAISMGYQTTVFAAAIFVTYRVMERRRRRLGLRGAEGIQGYLPGK